VARISKVRKENPLKGFIYLQGNRNLLDCITSKRSDGYTTNRLDQVFNI
ncbi:unnamed protein product, partial [Porites lobata]